MPRELNIVMIGHHRKHRNTTRAQAIARQLVLRRQKITLMVTADHRRFGIVESEWDGVKVVEAPDLLWGSLRSGWHIDLGGYEAIRQECKFESAIAAAVWALAPPVLDRAMLHPTGRDGSSVATEAVVALEEHLCLSV